MATLNCKNFGSCSLADSRKEFMVNAGGDDRCPECGMSLAAGEGERGTDDPPWWRRPPVVVVAVGGVLLLGGYTYWASRPAELKPQPTAQRAPGPVAVPAAGLPSGPTAAASAASAPSASAAASGPTLTQGAPLAAPHPESGPAAGPAVLPAVAAEAAARGTCDDATRAKAPDADRICRRAAAVTLLNSGAQAAVAGNLDQAERDYSAAREKDPDVPELYYNVALLKVRQGRNSEAVDNLILASSKGFRQFDLLKTEPAFQRLRNDPAYKQKLDGIVK